VYGYLSGRVRSQKSEDLIYTVVEAYNPISTFRNKITYLLHHEEFCPPASAVL
jgi:hypothetical protein